MADDNAVDDGAQKSPQDWKTGDDPATPAQMSHLESLAQQLDEKVPESPSKAEAAEEIGRLRNKAGLE